MTTFKRLWVFAMFAGILISCSSKTESDSNSSDLGSSVEESSEESSRPSPLEVKDGEIAGKAFKVYYGSPAVKGR